MVFQIARAVGRWQLGRSEGLGGNQTKSQLQIICMLLTFFALTFSVIVV